MHIVHNWILHIRSLHIDMQYIKRTCVSIGVSKGSPTDAGNAGLVIFTSAIFDRLKGSGRVSEL